MLIENPIKVQIDFQLESNAPSVQLNFLNFGVPQ